MIPIPMNGVYDVWWILLGWFTSHILISAPVLSALALLAVAVAARVSRRRR